MRQDQFLDVIDRDEAERRFRSALDLSPLDAEEVALDALLGRVLAADVVAPVDVPAFDRSNVDGFAIRAEDVYGAAEEQPARLAVTCEPLVPGKPSELPEVTPGTAIPIATGALLPRGANAVVMIEYTEIEPEEASGGRKPSGSLTPSPSTGEGWGGGEKAASYPSPPPQRGEGVRGRPLAWMLVRRPVAPGDNVTFAGTDIGRGETVLRRGEVLTSRETGVLAALGLPAATVVRRPRVAIASTGDELVGPGSPMEPGLVYDSNAVILADAVRELGGEPVPLGIVPDDASRLRAVLGRALDCDLVLLSGGTSKGAGDLSYRVVGELGPPGILAHGVALKPGKPLCLAAAARPRRRPVPVVVLPGFPTSAIFTFREFVAPVVRLLGGRPEAAAHTLPARLPFRVNSERGRTEYLLVGLVAAGPSESREVAHVAYPMGKGSGSVTTFSRADGFVVIGRQREYLEAGEVVTVHRLGQADAPLADLVVIGSHCTGLDYLLGLLAGEGVRSKVLAVGSSGGLAAARRGECDLAGIHLLDPHTGVYNTPFVGPGLELVRGYGRLQGLVFRKGDRRFEGRTAPEAARAALADTACALVNRNRGSGTRVLIDRLLGDARPAGYWTEAKSHNAVVAAVAQSRADWGVALAPVAADAGLGLIPLQAEQYDFVVPSARRERSAVVAFCRLLDRPEVGQALAARGFER